ncbi:Protein of unknown function [Marinospirillum celere]|uniref:DUF2783 domain-containing protein n=1 Tax=Marinospirillum celere TaxID=1122252 RepID=A0A1I1FNM1_9GAMM|nr:DUF2783 domain-containing protein [Marinospirillum celere]SFC00924.1 Protein of unknown function [Marinospirillum celere]
MKLNLNRNLEKYDDFYEKLIAMQRNKTEDQIQLMNAKLLLILANHIGDEQILEEAIQTASAS